jgi:hypothetical protein
MMILAQPVVVFHGVLFCASKCDSWWAMLNHRLCTIVSYTESIGVNHSVLCWASGCQTLWAMLSSLCRNHSVLCWTSGCESWCVILLTYVWTMVRYAEPEVDNYSVLYWASSCESFWVTLKQWLWIMCVGIMVCYSEPVVGNHGVNIVPVCVNHDELCGASGWDSLCVIICQYVWTMASYSESVVVNHVVFCWASGCESWWVMLRKWL